mmetsp:Transcript_52484/g.147342  ORF Transcript_52484/g.147342 Transcript_52484/m.147342 type:complete len:200 (+) Transcript_52484:319-918(+)
MPAAATACSKCSATRWGPIAKWTSSVAWLVRRPREVAPRTSLALARCRWCACRTTPACRWLTAGTTRASSIAAPASLARRGWAPSGAAARPSSREPASWAPPRWRPTTSSRPSTRASGSMGTSTSSAPPSPPAWSTPPSPCRSSPPRTAWPRSSPTPRQGSCHIAVPFRRCRPSRGQRARWRCTPDSHPTSCDAAGTPS